MILLNFMLTNVLVYFVYHLKSNDILHNTYIYSYYIRHVAFHIPVIYLPHRDKELRIQLYLIFFLFITPRLAMKIY